MKKERVSGGLQAVWGVWKGWASGVFFFFWGGGTPGAERLWYVEGRAWSIWGKGRCWTA